MSDIDQIVNKLEESIRKTEQELYRDSANMPKGEVKNESNESLISGKYILISIPLVILLIMYLVKPKFILKETKGKVISYGKFLGYSAVITAMIYAILFLFVKYGYINF